MHGVAWPAGHREEARKEREIGVHVLVGAELAATAGRSICRRAAFAGTDLNFATRPACGGLEIIGHNQTSAKTRGLHLHLTLATTGEGLPLGILRCGFDPPKASGAGSEAKHGNATEPGPEPRAGKDAKTQCWIQGLQDAGRVARELTGKTRVISVMDREADFYELFDEQRRIGRVEVLVRARHNRILEKGAPKLFAALRNQLPGGQVEIEIDRLTERPKSSRKEARPARSKRRARVEVRFRHFDLPSTVPGTQPVPMSVVHLRETNPPEGGNFLWSKCHDLNKFRYSVLI